MGLGLVTSTGSYVLTGQKVVGFGLHSCWWAMRVQNVACVLYCSNWDWLTFQNLKAVVVLCRAAALCRKCVSEWEARPRSSLSTYLRSPRLSWHPAGGGPDYNLSLRESFYTYGQPRFVCNGDILLFCLSTNTSLCERGFTSSSLAPLQSKKTGRKGDWQLNLSKR